MNLPVLLLPATSHVDLYRKVTTVIWALRGLGCVYAAWVLWLILRPLWGNEAFLQRLGAYWQPDLTGAQAWQIASVVLLDLCLWLLLLAVVASWWKVSRLLLRDMSLSKATSDWLRRGAWAGLSCTGLSVLTRPLAPYFYTFHLPAADRLWLWNVGPSDILGVVVSSVLLMLSYLMVWMREIAEENRAFV